MFKDSLEEKIVLFFGLSSLGARFLPGKAFVAGAIFASLGRALWRALSIDTVPTNVLAGINAS